MRKIWVGLLLCHSCWGAFETEGIDPRSSALGNSVSALSRGSICTFLNPAGLGQMTEPELYLGYSNQFGLAELSQEVVSFGSRLKNTGLAAGFSSFGKTDFYQEQKVSLSAGRQLVSGAGVGVSVNYLLLKADGYERQDAFSLDLGLLWEKDKFKLGGVVKNLNQPRIGGDRVLRNYYLGVSYSTLEQISLTAGLYYDTEFEEQVQLGQETNLSDNLVLRFGFQTEPNRYSLGAGFAWTKLEIDYAFVNHPELGGSHIIGMKLRW